MNLKYGIGRAKGYIFDMDGTLVDNCAWHVLAWQEFARRHGREIPRRQVLEWMGATSAYYMRRIFEREVPKHECDAMSAEKEALYRELYAPHLKLPDGLADLLSDAKARGVRIGIATGGPKENVDFIVDGLGIRGFFDVIVDCTGYVRGKPAPDCYLAAADALGTSPEDCMVFEDATNGIEAAHAAGMKVVAITFTMPRETLQGRNPCATIDSFTDLFDSPGPKERLGGTELECKSGIRAVVFGNGKSGKAAAELLRREGVAVSVLDGSDPWPEGAFDLAVTSPGVPLDHPWQVAARERNIRVISELQLGVERWRVSGGRLLAVTGSKGKSSVIKLVADTLNLAGVSAVPCGNYGKPLCEVVLENIPAQENAAAHLPWAVVEVSSFQMETTSLPPDAFEAAALLNLQDDHLDRHGSRETYHALKRQLLDFAVQPFDSSAVSASDVSAADRALIAGSYFDNPVLLANGAAAVRLLRAAGLADAAVAAGFAAFEPLPHRMSLVCIRDGVSFIDDSKATSIAALCAGVAMVAAMKASGSDGAGPSCLLIAGGLAKGDNPKNAILLLQSGVKKVYLIGRCAEQLCEAWSGIVPCEMCGTLANAVAAAKCDAVKGDVILLSPGAASFDQFQSYTERGAVFAALAKEGMNK